VSPSPRDDETWLERRIREAMEETPIHLLPGAGEPLTDLGGHDAPDWWARKFLARERAADAERDIAAEVKATLRTLWRLPDEETVRQWVASVNARIAALPVRSDAPLLDPDDVVGRWRAATG
jgi:hypothetical protein